MIITNFGKFLLEKLSKDDISSDDSLSRDEKREAYNKIDLDTIKDYENIKKTLEGIYQNLDKPIDKPTIDKLVDDNQFCKDYVQLLSNKRRVMFIERAMEGLEDYDKIQQYKDELTAIGDIKKMEQQWNKKISRHKSDLNSGKSLLKSKLSEY